MADIEKDDPEEFTSDKKGLADRWNLELRIVKRKLEKFHERGRKIVQRYRDEADAMLDFERSEIEGMNIFWSTIQTVKPALYARLPKCDFDRRFKDDDPLGREAAEVLERAAEFVISENRFHNAVCAARDDWLIPGWGTIWHRYEPVITKEVDEEGNEQEKLVYESVASEHVLWTDYLQDLAPSWDQTRWVAKRVQLTKGEIQKRFPEIDADALNYSYADEEESARISELSGSNQDPFKKAKIWEIWDKPSRRVYWHAENHDEILKVVEDPARLMGFFPCPEPLKATTTTDSQIPVPDFRYFQDQQALIDLIVTRKGLLIQALRLAGVRDASFEELDRLINDTDENQLIGVENWQAFMEAGGFEGVLQFLPLKDIAGALQLMEPLLQQEKEQIYEITGFSDILRGAANPYETATAQNIKSNFANLRLSDRQAEMQRFIRDNVAIIAELIAEHFSPQTLQLITGRSVTPQLAALLRSDGLRSFRIDIETDSTVAVNKEAERRDRLDALQVIGTFVERALPVAERAPSLVPFMGQSLKFLVHSFKSARILEDSLEKGIEGVMAQQPGGDQPDPAMVQAQMQAQQQQMQMQAEMQLKQAELQQKAQESAQQLQVELTKVQAEMQLKREEMMGKAKMKEAEQVMKREIEAAKIQAQLLAAQQQAQTAAVQAASQAQTETSKNGKSGEPLIVNLQPNITNLAPPAPPRTRKVVSLETDPLTGKKFGQVQEIPEE